jgi:hypothetical protein
MERFARIVVGYHGCSETFARKLLLGRQSISEWKMSDNRWDWLGKGVYFWEHSPERALRWAKSRFAKSREQPAVLGAIIQLGECFDLTDETFVRILSQTFDELRTSYETRGVSLPTNNRSAGKVRELDCLVINFWVAAVGDQG